MGIFVGSGAASSGPSSMSAGNSSSPSALARGVEHEERFLLLGGVAGSDLVAPQAPGLSCLGSLGLNVPGNEPPHPCGPGNGWFIDRPRRRQFPARCKKLTCDYCLPREAAIRQLILAESMPSRVWSETLVADAGDPDPWQTARHRINKLFELYRRVRPLGEASYVIEMNPAGTGYHMHAIQHGPFIDIATLASVRARAHVGLQGQDLHIVGDRHDAAGYGLKGFSVAGYSLKGFTAQEGRREALRINGGRLEHHTRGFIRVAGKSVTMRAAREAAMRKKYGPPSPDVYWSKSRMGDWVYDAPEYDDPPKRDPMADV